MPVKLAYKLSHRVLFPGPIERQSVQLTSAVFCESTLEALRYYSQRGHPEFSETAEFVSIILKWWKLVNSKSTFLSVKKRDSQREAISKENLTEKTSFLRGFVDWLAIWECSSDQQTGLSSETFQAAKHSSEGLSEIFEYLLLHTGVKFVLPIKFQNDKIEGKFGQLRQMCGGNLFASVRQFLESYRSLRMMNLAGLKLESDEFHEIFAEVNYHQEELNQAAAENIARSLCSDSDVEVVPEIPEADQDSLLYVSGCFSRQIAKAVSCQSCKNFVLENNDDSFVLEKSFVAQVNRGGLTIPSKMSFLSCAHAWSFYKKIFAQPNLKSALLSQTTSPRKVFILAFEKYLSSSHDSRLNFIEQSCEGGHCFKKILSTFAAKCFNIFSKNYVSVLNSAIHENRKRTSDPDSKRISSTLKSKKLTSDTL